MQNYYLYSDIWNPKVQKSFKKMHFFFIDNQKRQFLSLSKITQQ